MVGPSTSRAVSASELSDTAVGGLERQGSLQVALHGLLLANAAFVATEERSIVGDPGIVPTKVLKPRLESPDSVEETSRGGAVDIEALRKEAQVCTTLVALVRSKMALRLSCLLAKQETKMPFRVTTT